MVLVALMSNLAVAQNAKNLLEVDLSSFRPVQTGVLEGVNIDAIGKDRSQRPCARIKLHINRMTPQEIDQIQVLPIGGNIVVMKRELAYEGNGLIIELTAKQPTRFILHHNEFGDSNEVSVNLEGNKEYFLDAELRQLYPITVNTNMADADVYIDNKYCGKTNSEMYLLVHDILPGDHTLRVECAGRRAEMPINIHKESLVFRLDVDTAAARPQYVVFEVVPQNALVTIDNTPYYPEAGVVNTLLQNGPHAYSVEAKNYHKESGTIIVAGAKVERKIELRPAFGYLNVTASSVISGASIFIDDELIGTAPMRSGPLASGEHRVRIVKPKYKIFEQTITISDNQVLEFAPALTADFAVVTITAGEGCEIWIDNERKGLSPWREELSSGTHIFEARKDGHESSVMTQNITVTPHEQQYTLDAPKPILGTLNITSSPAMADVYIDGENKGRTPLMVDVVVGERNIKLHKAGFGDFELKATVTKGEITSVSHKFDSSDMIYNEGKSFYDAKNYTAAFPKLKQAADLGHAEANYYVGVSYDFGRGVQKNDAEAVKYYRVAAEKGLAAAQNDLGVMYRSGEGVDKNEAEAVKWYRLAANQGHALAQNNLGVCYEKGYGVAKDMVEAVKWYRKAAEQGNAGAQNSLGICYRQGLGVEKNEAEAVKWYRMAANQGNSAAMFNLGLCYEFGRGVPKDLTQAKAWYQKSADKGYSRAKDKLRELNSSSSSSSSSYSSSSTGGYIVNEQFSSASSAWQKSKGQLSFSGGKMIFEDLDASGYSILTYNLPRNLKNEDFQVEFSAKVDFKEKYNSLIFMLGTRWDDNYRLCFTDWGEGNIRVSIGDDRENKKYYGYSNESRLSTSTSHKYTIIKRGSTIELHADGKFVYSGNINLSKHITVMGFLVPKRFAVEVDYITIQSLSSSTGGSSSSYSSSSSSSSSYSSSVPSGLTAKQYYDLGENYADGKNGKSKDDKKAFAHFMKAAEMGYTAAYWKVGLEYCYGPGVEKNYVEAVKWWKKHHEESPGGARYTAMKVGDLYKTGGYGLSADRNEAIRWYRISANLGYEDATKKLREMGVSVNGDSSSSSSSSSGGKSAEEYYQLAENYDDGKNGYAKDNTKAFQNYLKAAEMGYREAYWKVGLKYRYGLGTSRDYAEAAKWWAKYCEIVSGSSYVAKCLGDIYKEGGYGISANRDEAIRWYRISADRGSDDGKKALREMGIDPNSRSSYSSSSPSSSVNAGGMTAKECYEMGKNYESGKNGKPKDVRKAFQYYLKAAEMGCADAYWCVGLEYMYGPGLDKNYVEAVRWFKKNYEAHSWSTTSAKCIGECYRDGGYGLTANREEAIRWFREAANKGNDDAKKALRDMGVR